MTDQGNIPAAGAVSLSKHLGEGVTVHNLGGDMLAVDQIDADTKVMQRVILSRADLEGMLTWIG